MECYLKQCFQRTQASRSMSWKQKHSSSTWGHDFKSSDPKIVGQEGKPLRIRQWSHESCQFSCKYLQLLRQHCMSFPQPICLALSPIIPSIFMHSSIPFIPTGQGMRCRSKHNHMRGTFNEATLESMLMITFLLPIAFAIPIICLSCFVCRRFC